MLVKFVQEPSSSVYFTSILSSLLVLVTYLYYICSLRDEYLPEINIVRCPLFFTILSNHSRWIMVTRWLLSVPLAMLLFPLSGLSPFTSSIVDLVAPPETQTRQDANNDDQYRYDLCNGHWKWNYELSRTWLWITHTIVSMRDNY